MTTEFGYACGAWAFAGTSDRYVPAYSEQPPLEEQIRLAGQVPDLDGLEFIYPHQFEGTSPAEVEAACDAQGIEIVALLANNFSDQAYKYGAFTSGEPEVRDRAIQEAKETIDVARELGCPQIDLWLGQDGYDYPFQADYRAIWEREASAIAELADYAPDIRIGVEYKLKEPRTSMLLRDVATTLLMLDQIDRPNAGVLVDIGHSFVARETPGAAVVRAAEADRLFGVHFNDNYGEWDDDMIAGAVTIWQNLEFLYWIQVMDYEGWLTLDLFPYREDPVKAAGMSIRNIKSMAKMLDRIDWDALQAAQSTMRATEVLEIVRPAVYSD